MVLPTKMTEGNDEMNEDISSDVETTAEAAPSKSKKRWNMRKMASLGILLAIVAVGAWTFFSGEGGLALSSGAYQAVFLDNNQVYFGRLTNVASAYPVLKDIFYLRVTQGLQPPEGGDAQPNINLVKLGTELHGPSDEMRINREHILFIEDLKDDSEVTKAIRAFKEQQGN
ncbi:MAG: hypothetical protein HYT22_03335 [Candidatus Niyogibacteria bacterium]|nr:hypothetical protein [Candidatus Niyogibacteria bacterium]